MLAILFCSLFVSCCYASYTTMTISILKEEHQYHEFHDACPITGQVIEGFTWSRCRESANMAIGCATETGLKLKFGEIYSTPHAQFRCDSDGSRAMFTPVACVVDDQPIAVGQMKGIGKFHFICDMREGGIGLRIAGCSDSSGQFVSIDASFTRGNFIYQCQLDGEKVYEFGVGCVTDDYGVSSIDEVFRAGSYYYQCSRKGLRGVRLEPVGCVNAEGEFVSIGERFSLGFITYECEEYSTAKGKTSIRQKPVGCLVKKDDDDQVETFVFGERWYKPIKQNLGYTLECAQRGQTVTPVVVECVASSDSDRKAIPVGCGIVYDKGHIFVCKDLGQASVMARVKSVSKGKTHKSMIAEHDVALC